MSVSSVRAVEWIDHLPGSWEVSTLGRDSWIRARLGWKGLKADEYVDDGIPMLATPDIKNPEIDFTAANKISLDRFEESPEIMLATGDVLLTKDGSTIGTVNVVRRLEQPATVNGSIAVITPFEQLDGRFLYWFIASGYAQALFDRLRGGMGVPHLFQADIKRIRYLRPSRDQQRAIADYLDRETAQIDTLIAEQQRLIELLHERRAAAIEASFASATVNSRLRYACHEIIDCPHTTPARDETGGYEAVRTASVRQGAYRHGNGIPVSAETWSSRNSLGRPELGDVLFTREAPAGEACMVPSERICLGQRMVLLKVNREIAVGEFVLWQLYSKRVQEHFETTSNGSTVTNVRLPVLRSLPIFLPPLEEQRRIVAELDKVTAKIDTLIAEAERFIELAKERRSALITAAVTGQIDIPGVE